MVRGPVRWRAERDPILGAIDAHGDLVDVAKVVEASGLAVAGETQGGIDRITRFAWVDREF